MIALITGGRDFTDAAETDRRLSAIPDLRMVIQGDCRGADILARDWCQAHQKSYMGLPARWDAEGRSAGFKRNTRMLKVALALAPALGETVCLIAFPGGKGTAHCVREAQFMNIEVRFE